MLEINIVAAGKIKEDYLARGIREYVKRLAPFAKVTISEIREEKMPHAPSEAEKKQALEREGVRLKKLVTDGSFLVALDVHGEELSSEELAKKIGECEKAGAKSITFIIGGPFGLGENVRKVADFRLSFSKMTFTHQMVRLLFVEQLYRAFTIIKGEKYHND